MGEGGGVESIGGGEVAEGLGEEEVGMVEGEVGGQEGGVWLAHITMVIPQARVACHVNMLHTAYSL